MCCALLVGLCLYMSTTVVYILTRPLTPSALPLARPLRHLPPPPSRFSRIRDDLAHYEQQERMRQEEEQQQLAAARHPEKQAGSLAPKLRPGMALALVNMRNK